MPQLYGLHAVVFHFQWLDPAVDITLETPAGPSNNLLHVFETLRFRDLLLQACHDPGQPSLLHRHDPDPPGNQRVSASFAFRRARAGKVAAGLPCAKARQCSRNLDCEVQLAVAILIQHFPENIHWQSSIRKTGWCGCSAHQTGPYAFDPRYRRAQSSHAFRPTGSIARAANLRTRSPKRITASPTPPTSYYNTTRNTPSSYHPESPFN